MGLGRGACRTPQEDEERVVGFAKLQNLDDLPAFRRPLSHGILHLLEVVHLVGVEVPIAHGEPSLSVG